MPELGQMKQFLIGWTAETLEGPQWGECEFSGTIRVEALEWAWRHLDTVTGLNLRRVLSLSIGVKEMSDAEGRGDELHIRVETPGLKR